MSTLATIYTCPDCASPDVEMQVWTRFNDPTYDGGEAGGYIWCHVCDLEFKFCDEHDNPHALTLTHFQALHAHVVASRPVR